MQGTLRGAHVLGKRSYQEFVEPFLRAPRCGIAQVERQAAEAERAEQQAAAQAEVASLKVTMFSGACVLRQSSQARQVSNNEEAAPWSERCGMVRKCACRLLRYGMVAVVATVLPALITASACSQLACTRRLL